MDENGHQTHTAPLYLTVDEKPVRASVEDARYFITWIDNLLEKTAKGGEWSKYFTHDQKTVQQRYRQARSVYKKILVEAEKTNK